MKKDKKEENGKGLDLSHCECEKECVCRPRAPELDYKEQFMMAMADFQNYKRRVEQDQRLWSSEAKASVIGQILPVIDDFDRALESAPEIEQDSVKKWVEGLNAIFRNTHSVFVSLGIKEIDCSGDFDPHFHEALCRVKSEEHQSGQIVQVLRKGYLMGDVVIRHAQVSVCQ